MQVRAETDHLEVVVNNDAAPVDWDDAVAAFLLAAVEQTAATPPDQRPPEVFYPHYFSPHIFRPHDSPADGMTGA